MHYKNHDTDAAHRRMREQLLRMGWTKHKCPYPANGKVELMAAYHSPHIHNSFFWFENCLKKINPTGEVYYALEMRCSEMEHLSWRCNLDNPNNRHPLDTLDAFDMARKYMLDGLQWDYGTGKKDEKGIIKIIDWENPENNTFEFVENWQGALNDGFGWDFILCINAIPLCGIVIEKGSSGSNSSNGSKIQGTQEISLKPSETLKHSETLQSALDMAQYQLDNDFQFPVYCHALVISDGEKMMIGDPWLELDGFQEIGTLKEALRPVDFLMNCMKTIPE